MGLPIRCYVFPRYENVCAAYDLCALPAVRVANSAKHNSASVFMRASFVDISVELISLPNELVTQRLLHSFIGPTTSAHRRGCASIAPRSPSP